MTEQQALAKVAATWPELDAWRDRFNAPFSPAAGSDLAHDDSDWPPQPISQVAWHGLASATMHLHAIRFHLDSRVRPPELIPFAQMTLGRSALIGATQAVWVLSPDDPAERVMRARMSAEEYLNEHRKYLAVLTALAPDHASTRIVSELTNQRLNELKALRERDGQRVKLNTTQIVQDAAATTFPDNAEVQADILSMWRKSSGSAHGLIWSLLGGHSSREATAEELTTPPVAAADAEVVVHQRSGEMIALANLYLAVHLIAKRGWKLLDGRGQRADQAVRGRQR